MVLHLLQVLLLLMNSLDSCAIEAILAEANVWDGNGYNRPMPLHRGCALLPPTQVPEVGRVEGGSCVVPSPSWMQAEDAPEKLRGVFEPIVRRLYDWFTPTKTWVRPALG